MSSLLQLRRQSLMAVAGSWEAGNLASEKQSPVPASNSTWNLTPDPLLDTPRCNAASKQTRPNWIISRVELLDEHIVNWTYVTITFKNRTHMSQPIGISETVISTRKATWQVTVILKSAKGLSCLRTISSIVNMWALYQLEKKHAPHCPCNPFALGHHSKKRRDTEYILTAPRFNALSIQQSPPPAKWKMLFHQSSSLPQL